MRPRTRYRYGIDRSARIVDVMSLQRETLTSADHFQCIGCGGRLIAHLKDDRRARHFAHHRETGCVSYETYLHAAGKLAFVETFRDRLNSARPYMVQVPVTDTCTYLRDSIELECPWPTHREIDLVQWFDCVTAESGNSEFRADVLLSSSRTRHSLFLEIAVTHACEPEKIASGIRIIEIAVKSDAEIDLIRSGELRVEENGPVRAHNFKVRQERGPRCMGECPREVAVFVVYRSGRAKLFTIPASKAAKFRPSSTVFQRVLTQFEEAPAWVGIEQLNYIGTDLPVGDTLFQRAAMKAILAGANVRSCDVCVHQGSPYLFSQRWCHVYKQQVHPGKAAECESFKSLRTVRELELIRRKNKAWMARRRW
jgi:hypothetical protein